MKILVRAIVTGFGLSVGSYVFRKISAKYNLEPKPESQTPAPAPTPNNGGDLARQPS
ncbi:MAG: hypothetical protein QM831_23130 [Kofleriaceae bacterium]